MIDLDALEQAARAATPGPWHVREISYPERAAPEIYADNRRIARINKSKVMPAPESNQNVRFIAAANPAVVLELIARLKRAEALLAEFVADWEDGSDFDHRQLRGYVSAARSILPPVTPSDPPSGVGTF